MDKVPKTILIISFAVLGIGFLAAPITYAQSPPNLVVQFQNTPLFSEANFLPGEGLNRWISVTNNSGEIKKIAIETINENDPDNFASQLNLIIKEEAIDIFNGTLKNFFDNGETYLSDLANGATTQYDFTITFDSTVGNDYQGKRLGFDLLIGFQGTEGTGGGISGGSGSGGSGGSLPSGLLITNETTSEVKTTSATIIWLTNYNSTSQVVYAAEGESHDLNINDNGDTPPKYGYAHTTPEADTDPKVTSHSVSINGLTAGTKYYYRAVSHASLAISQEYNFNTLTPKTGGEEEKNNQEDKTIAKDNEITTSGSTSNQTGNNAGGSTGIAGGIAGSGGNGEEDGENGELSQNFLPKKEGIPGGGGGGYILNENNVPSEENGFLGNLFGGGGLLAAMGTLPFNFIIFLIIILLAISILFIFWLSKPKKKKEE